MRFKTIISALIIFFVAGLGGCASFEQERIPRVEKIPDVTQFKNKPTAYVEFAFYIGKAESNPVEIERVNKDMQPIIAKAIDKTKLFSNFTFDKEQAGFKDYTIKVSVYNHGNMGAAVVSGFISGFTLGLIPGAATDNYTVKVEAMDKQGNSLSKHTNDDAVRTWIGLWFIPMMGNTPREAVTNTLENQVITALIQLFNDDVLKYSFSVPKADPTLDRINLLL